MKKLFTLAVALMLLVAGGFNIAQAQGDFIYSNAYDGFTNIRQQPNAKSKIIGKLPNGNNAAEFIEESYENDNWYYIYYKGTYGYVAKSQIGWTPYKTVNLKITAKWLTGVWVDGTGNKLTLDNKGNFMVQGPVSHAGKWRLSGGNDLTLKATYGSWNETYIVDLDKQTIGQYVREGAQQSPLIAAAINSANMTDSELSQVLYHSSTGEMPIEFQWIKGEWRAANNNYDAAMVTDKWIRSNNCGGGAYNAQEISDIEKMEYTIGYRYNNDVKRYYLALIPNGNLPVVYINTIEQRLFFINNSNEQPLIRVADAETSSSTSLNSSIIIGLVAGGVLGIIGIVVFLIVRLTSKKKQN